MKRRETNVFCRALSVILTLMLSLSVMPAVFAETGTEAADSGVIEIMPFQDFETNYDSDKWGSYAEWTKFPAPANGKLGDVRNADGFSCGDWAFPSDFNTKLTDGTVKKIIVLAKAELADRTGSDRVEISLVDSPNNAGGSPIQKLFAVCYDAPRLRSYDKDSTLSTGNKVELGRTITFPFKGDLAAVIDVNEDGKTGQATYYHDGARMQTTAQGLTDPVIPAQEINLEGTKHIRFSLHRYSTGYFDNTEVFALTSATAPAVQYLGLTTANGGTLHDDGISQDDSFAMKFDSPIILGALEGKIAINGETVSMDRISLSADRRSVIVAAPFGGYRGNTQTVTVSSGGIQSYTGGSYTKSLSETVKVQMDTNARKTDIIPYQDFAKDADLNALLASGVWDRASDGADGDVLEAKDGKLVMTRGDGTRTLNKGIDLSKVEEGMQMVVLTRMQATKDSYYVRNVLSTYDQWGAKTGCALVGLYKEDTSNGIYTGKGGGPTMNKAPDMTVNLNQWYDTAAVLTFHKSGEGDPTADIEYYVDGVNTGTGVKNVGLTGSAGLADQLALFVEKGYGAYDDIEAYLVTPGEGNKLLPLQTAATPLTNENGTAITSISENGSFVIHFNNPIIASSAADLVSVNEQAVKTTLTADRRGMVVTAPEGGWTGSKLDIVVSADTQGYATEKLGEKNTLTLPFEPAGESVLSASVMSASVSNGNAVANVRVRNTTDEVKKVMILLTEYTGSDTNSVLNSIAVKTVELEQNERENVELSLSGVTEGSTVKVFIWDANTLVPVLKNVHTVDVHTVD